MKSLIIKDVYNILHNMKSLFLMLFVFLFLILPKGGAAAYAITCCILCAMMIVTTFSFDENAKWEKYAMVMPVSRKDLVLSKFVVLLFSASSAWYSAGSWESQAARSWENSISSP